MTVDLDSTFITSDGSQDGSTIGYHLNRKGRDSHHPLMALIGQTRMVVNACLLSGNRLICRFKAGSPFGNPAAVPLSPAPWHRLGGAIQLHGVNARYLR